MNGMDLSRYQAGMNIAITGADFAIVQVTKGFSRDAYMQEHADQVLNNGMLLGLYHYAKCNNGKDEADEFLDYAAPYIGQALIALDGEGDALSNGPDGAEKGLDYVAKQTGTNPVIYMSKSVCNAYDWSSVASKYKLGVAQYGNNDQRYGTNNPGTDSNSFGAGNWPFIFQYCSKGIINGYGGDVDLDLCYGTKDEGLMMEGNDMQLTDMIVDNGYIMGDTSYANVGNCLYWGEQNAEKAYASAKDALTYAKKANTNASNCLTKIKAIETKIDNLGVIESKIDYEKLANLVCDKMAARMKN